MDEKASGLAKEVEKMIPARWDPFREALSLQDRMNRIFSDFQYRFGGDEPVGAWTPPVDIFEADGALVVRAEIPGVKREDIEVSVQNGALILKGERQKESELGDENVYRIERQYGTFARSFTLPTQVDASKIKATYRDGILEITLPKSAEAKPKKVEIHAA